MSDLVICKLSDCSCTVAGGKEIILLCEKVAKGKKTSVMYAL
jgi:Rel/ankyrin family protein